MISFEERSGLMVQAKSDAYLDGFKSVNLDALKRRRPEKIKCRSGYEQRGAACQPIKRKLNFQENETFSSVNPKKRKGLKVAGFLATATGLAIAGSALYMVHDLNKNLTPKKEEEPPKTNEVKPDELDKLYDEFQPGDMIRHSFEIKGKVRAWHYGIYAGRNEETGKHEVIDVQVDEEKGGRKIGKREMIRDTGLSGASIFQKVPLAKLSNDRLDDREEIMARAESLINQKFRYTVGANNCETFARMVVENTPQTKDIESLSWFTKGIFRALPVQFLEDFVTNKNQFGGDNSAKGLTIETLRNQVEQASSRYKREKRARQDARSSQSEFQLSSLFYKEPEQSSDTTINGVTSSLGIFTPTEASELINQITDGFPGSSSKVIRASLIKEYTLLVSSMVALLKEQSKTVNTDSVTTRCDRLPIKRPKKIKCKLGYEQRGGACQPIKPKKKSIATPNDTTLNLQKQAYPRSSFSPFKQKLLLAIGVAGLATLGKTIYDHKKYAKDVTPDDPKTLNLVSKDQAHFAYHNAEKSLGKGTSGEALLTSDEHGQAQILKIPNLEQIPMPVFVYGAASEAICSDMAERAGIPINKVQLIPADHVPVGKTGTRYGATLQEIAKGESLEDITQFKGLSNQKGELSPSELIRSMRFEKMMVVETDIPKTISNLTKLSNLSNGKYNTDDLIDIFAFDTFIMNGDRHKGNIFLDEQTGRFTGIDNGLAFSFPEIGEKAFESLAFFKTNEGQALLSDPQSRKALQRYRDKLHTLYTQNTPSQIKNKFAGYMSTVKIGGIPAFLQELKVGKSIDLNHVQIKKIIVDLDAYLQTSNLKQDSIMAQSLRLDRRPIRRPKKLKCKPGYEQRGAACQKIKPKKGEPTLNQGDAPQFETDERVTKKKRSKKILVGALLATGVAGLAVAGTVGAIAIDIKKNVTPKDDEIPPLKKKFTKEQLDQIYDNMKPGDMIRRTFNQSNVIKAWHYGIYAGRNPETGEHEIIHTNAKDGNVKILRESLHKGQEEDSIYENVPENLINRGDKPKSREEIMARAESLIDKPYDFSFAYRNCEAIARGIVEGKINTRQPEKLSGFTKGVAKHIMDPLIRVALGKQKQLGNDEITAILDQTSSEFMAKQQKKASKQDSIFCLRLDQSEEEVVLNAGYGTSIANLFLKEPVINQNVAQDIKSATVNDFTDAIGVIRPQEANDLIENLVSQIEGSSRDEIKLNLFRDYLMAITSVSKLRTEGVSSNQTEEKSDSYWIGYYQVLGF